MVKRKIEKIEDAEIIASKEEKYDNSLVLIKVNKLQMQFIMLFVIFLIALVMTSGALVYIQFNRSEEIITLKKDFKTLTPTVSFEFINNAMNDLQLQTEKETISLIDQAVKNLEEVFVDKLNSISDIGDNSEVVKLFEDELVKLQLKFDKNISEVSKINNEKREDFLIQEMVSDQIQTMVDNLDLKLQREFNIYNNKFSQREKEFLLLKNKLLNIELSVLEKPNKSLNVNMELLSELDKSFVKIAYNALKMEAQRSIEGNPWSKFISTIKSLFVFRSIEPKEGNTLDAILSRAQYMLSLRNFEECLNELHTLDEVSLELFSAWMKKTTLLSNTIN